MARTARPVVFFLRGRIVKVVLRFRSLALCAWVDGQGIIHQHWCEYRALARISDALGARSLWPESGNLDLLAIAEEEQRAKAERKAHQQMIRKMSRKPRASKKAKAA